MLRIVQYDGGAGYYLMYVDNEGRELTDTWHESLDAAMAQATWEFRVEPEDWSSAAN
jgi:hypothetical protein